MFCLLDLCVLSQANAGLPATKHRRVACSFRDQSLFQIFQISLTSLGQLKNDGKIAILKLNLFFLSASEILFGDLWFESCDYVFCSHQSIARIGTFSFFEMFII
jgi:hypothetical protein